MYWLAYAPSNIALIKYMGKKDGHTNLPDNSSLSYTLEHLKSTVQLQAIPGKRDIWEPLTIPGSIPFNLSIEGQNRFIAHLNRIKAYFDYQGSFLIQSCNNFPHSSGLASSASSFAALTKCAVLALCALNKKEMLSIAEQAHLSRLGSGSSCRSFYAPWALWQGESVEAVDIPYTDLIHQVIIISHDEKAIASSEAHKRVKTSPFYARRAQAAEEHLKLLINAFMAQDWGAAYKICWREFQDMHQLFETSKEPFSYQTDESRKVLYQLEALWEAHGDGPIVTMDAGPNIHLLYRSEQMELARQFKVDYLLGNYDVL